MWNRGTEPEQPDRPTAGAAVDRLCVEPPLAARLHVARHDTRVHPTRRHPETIVPGPPGWLHGHVTWNYSGNPAASDLDRVRFLARDTIQTDPLTLQDEEWAWLITEHEDASVSPVKVRPYTTAAAGVFNMITRAGRFFDSQTGDVRKARSTVMGSLLEVYEGKPGVPGLKQQAEAVEGASKLTIIPVNLSAGGLPDVDEEPYFRAGMMDNPQAGDDPDTAGAEDFGPGLFPFSR